MVIAKGSPMEAVDVLNLAFFPKGTVLMYKGSGWQDNTTLKGWYICNGQTVQGEQVPDLVDKFVRGATSAGAGAGADYQDITKADLPAHTHSAGTLSATKGSSKDTGGDHSHSMKVAKDGVPDGWDDKGLDGRSHYWHSDYPSATSNTDAGGGHTHTISGSTGSVGTGTALRIATVPAYYKLIYIIKMSPHGSVTV